MVLGVQIKTHRTVRLLERQQVAARVKCTFCCLQMTKTRLSRVTASFYWDRFEPREEEDGRDAHGFITGMATVRYRLTTSQQLIESTPL